MCVFGVLKNRFSPGFGTQTHTRTRGICRRVFTPKADEMLLGWKFFFLFPRATAAMAQFNPALNMAFAPRPRCILLHLSPAKPDCRCFLVVSSFCRNNGPAILGVETTQSLCYAEILGLSYFILFCVVSVSAVIMRHSRFKLINRNLFIENRQRQKPIIMFMSDHVLWMMATN